MTNALDRRHFLFGSAMAAAGTLLPAAGLGAEPQQTFPSAINEITATLNAGETRAPVSKYIYGQFIEQLRDLINRGLWAEMIDDRKFFFEINSKPDVEPAQPRFPGRARPHHWRPVGRDEFVVMDRERPYTGEHTPRIRLEGETPRGIQQRGLWLRKGKTYAGRVVLAGSRRAKVSVTLVWGPGASDRQTIAVPALRDAYAKHRLKFSPKADTDDGRIEITGTGNESFHIGAVSLMPADNIHGFRADTVGLLKQLRSGIYRFPGGNFVSNHEWRDAIGDVDRRPPRWDNAWSWVQPNDVGIDEFMILCGLLDVEPYITVNAGFGDAMSAEHLVAYANGSTETTMGRLRAANGHSEPYNIKWWGIGNEMYGPWQLGHMVLKQYVLKHNIFAKAMLNADPTIKLVASGASPDEMTVDGLSLPLTGKVAPDFGSAADWTGGLFLHCLDNMDVVSEHFYVYNGQRFDLAQNKRVAVTEPLIEWARRPANRVRTKVEAYENYLQQIPALREKRVPINIDEYAYAGARPNLKNALSLAWALHEMFRHTDIITMAAHTMGTSCIDYTHAEAAMNTLGMMFKLYRDHFGDLPVEVTGNSPQPAPKYPVGGDQPRVNAGSDTHPLDVAAALKSGEDTLTVAILNPTESAQKLNLDFQGIHLRNAGRMWRMTGPSADSATGLGSSEVKVTEAALEEIPKTCSVAPLSIDIYEFEKG
ncbi:MAG TPA: alpha-N-arabinofuranosidase [Terriglobia bacterium]|nr:alpha-N-arabinofuranosidase [Terriglobia bacterium]